MYEFAQQTLHPREARLLKHYVDESTRSEYLVIAWTGLERDYFEQYKGFLEKFTWLTNFEQNPNDVQRVVDDPRIGPEEVKYAGAWLQTSVTKSDDSSSELIMTLLRVYNTVKDEEGLYRASLLNKEQYRSSEANLVLQFRNLDPRNLDALVKASFSASDYTDIKTREDTYSGSWTNVESPSAHDESGAGIIIWMVTKHNNDDAVFRYHETRDRVITVFKKYRAVESGLDDFRDHYYFDENGMYYSSDGVNYTKLDAEDVDPAQPLPATARRLNQAVSGRVSEMGTVRREDDRTTDLQVRIVHTLNSDESGLIFRSTYNQVQTYIELNEVDETRKDDFLQNTYIDSSGNWYSSSDGTNYTRKNGSDVDPAQPLPASAVDLDGVAESRRFILQPRQDNQTKLWSLLLECSNIDSDVRCSYIGSDTRLVYQPSSGISIKFDFAHNIKKTELDSAFAYYNTTPPDGTERFMGDPRYFPETGLYSYEAREVIKSPVAVSFRVGPETVYLGFNYNKIPTTDVDLFNADNPEAVGVVPESDNYYLIGAKWSGSAWTCLIDSKSNLFGTPDLNQADNTWNWRIRHIAEVEGNNIGSNPDADHTNAFIFEHGDQLDFERYVDTYTMQEIVSGGLSLLSYFENVPANTFGTHAALTNRRKVTPMIKNDRVIDGKLSFDLYERVQTPRINDDDEWYYYGATESLERNKENLASDMIRRDGGKYPGDGVSNPTKSAFYEILQKLDTDISDADAGADGKLGLSDIQADNDAGTPKIDVSTPILARLQLASKQRATVERRRKYFMRQPTDADLQASAYDGTYSIKQKWDLVKQEQTSGTAPNASKVDTFDIVRVGGGMWAVENMIVRRDDQVYKDPEAFDHFIDSDGNHMAGLSLMVLHADATLNSVFTEETEA